MEGGCIQKYTLKKKPRRQEIPSWMLTHKVESQLGAQRKITVTFLWTKMPLGFDVTNGSQFLRREWGRCGAHTTEGAPNKAEGHGSNFVKGGQGWDTYTLACGYGSHGPNGLFNPFCTEFCFLSLSPVDECVIWWRRYRFGLFTITFDY